MTGADAVPPAGEILERFRGDLLKVETRVGQREAVEADAAQTAGRFSDSLDSASARLADAYDERSHVRGMVIAALEAPQDDPDDRETVAAIMEVKGRSEEDTRDYFAHMGRLGEREQPVVIINGAGALATSSSAVVIFGRTVPGDDHPAAFGAGRWPGNRNVVVPITHKIGFGSSGLDSAGRSGKEMFVGTAEEDGVEDITVNPNNHPFEEVHFASSEEEVDRLIAETAEADTREEADQNALEGFGVPSLVAYGEDAVKAVAARLAGRSEGHDIFTRRALDELGLYAWDGKGLSGAEVSEEMAENLRLQFNMALIGFVNDSYSRPSAGDKITGTLVFLAPLQEKIGIDESAVVQELKAIKGRNLEVHRDAANRYVANTKEGIPVIDAMILAAEGLAKHGVSVSPTSHELRKTGYDLELRALRDELKFMTTPGLEPITRHRLKRDMRATQLTALALGVQPRLTPQS